MDGPSGGDRRWVLFAFLKVYRRGFFFRRLAAKNASSSFFFCCFGGRRRSAGRSSSLSCHLGRKENFSSPFISHFDKHQSPKLLLLRLAEM